MIRIIMLIFCICLLIGCHPSATHVFRVTDDASYSASLSEDGQYALVSTASNGVLLWDLKASQLKYHWQHGNSASESDNSVFATAISANAHYAATLSNSSLVIWNIHSGGAVGWWSLPVSAQSVAIANNAQTLVGLIDGSVMSLAPEQSLIKFLGHQERVSSVSISADGQRALTGSNDGTAILWQAQTGQPIQQWQLESRLSKVQLNQRGSLSFVSDIKGHGYIYHNDTGTQQAQLAINRRQMTFSSARFIQQDKQLITGSPSKEIILWDTKTGKKQTTRQIQLTKNSQNRGAVVYSIASDENQNIISISNQGLVETWGVLE
ncbi:WD40 repeat domain-containing protein [Shewanella sp. UCD-KL21]|uniref:WD40 repeat domain-containing protein n=1 Tax=Shewanella sp. UCD-KL21 TaxID=1917164 RepID=UPI00097074CE|nr:WD40 repeat domain-containing protein [Shewanella sp. UCD-KL21]